MAKSTDRIERFRMALSNAGFDNVGKRTRADEDGDPLLPWSDGTPPASLEEVEAVRRAYNITYSMTAGFPPEWVADTYRAWSPIPDAWWLVTFNSDEPNLPPDLLGGIMVDTPLKPLALRRAIEAGVKPKGKVTISGPFIWRDIPAPCPLNEFMIPPDMIEYGLHHTQ